MSETQPDGEVLQLPAHHFKRSPHQFGDPVSVPANAALDRHQQTERTCKICGAVKVTVHAPDGHHWRAWRKGASTAQIDTFDALPCEPSIGMTS